MNGSLLEMPTPVYLGDDVKYSMPAFLWRSTQYMRFSLKKEEKQMHQSAVFFMLNNAKNGEIVSWYSKKRKANGKVRVIHSYPTGAGICRTYQAYIKINGAQRHMTNNACKKHYSIGWSFYK
jgi:surface antigen